MKSFTRMKLAGAGLVLAALTSGASVGADPAQTASAQLKDQNGTVVGSADLMQTPAGLLIKLALKDMRAGQHAVHIHTVGKCEPPFESTACSQEKGMRVICQTCTFRRVVSLKSRW